MSDQGIVLPPEANAPPAATPNTVFRGVKGIRAGWRALIFLAIVGIVSGVGAIVIGLVMQFLKTGNTRFGASTLTPVGLGDRKSVV
jgi:hypothetical protein